MHHRRISPVVALSVATMLATLIAGCGETSNVSSSPSGSAPGVPPSPSTDAAPDVNPAAVVEDVEYRPVIEPADFTTSVKNPYFPLVPGSTRVYEGDGERIEYSVTTLTRTVMGVETVVVRDRAFKDGKLIEDTEDWFAQDGAGNVWYFGEDTAECKDGKPVSRHGAWEAGIDGAQPGVVMLADPQIGDLYRQEFYAGEAEDQGRVLMLGDAVEVPAGAYRDVLVTEDFTPLEPDLLEHKLYAPGVGVVEERTIKGGTGVLRLVEVTVDSGSAAAPTSTFDPCRE